LRLPERKNKKNLSDMGIATIMWKGKCAGKKRKSYMGGGFWRKGKQKRDKGGGGKRVTIMREEEGRGRLSL